ncbi:hypothetical protein P7K49_004634 [Saguinus oedipus]|uniref:Uncharacterized protein n=1 Tax=Saguinus oedipus TaxID=9490 RepID=A0ABQ9W806_SAGOE|nr:hypothetical protein P7K49_004634 [Saguinus oedipus]
MEKRDKGLEMETTCKAGFRALSCVNRQHSQSHVSELSKLQDWLTYGQEQAVKNRDCAARGTVEAEATGPARNTGLRALRVLQRKSLDIGVLGQMLEHFGCKEAKYTICDFVTQFASVPSGGNPGNHSYLSEYK